MSLVPSNFVQIQNQVLPNGAKPYVNQMNAGQMVGQVQFWNPNLSQTQAITHINNALRKFYDRKTWYGLFVRGQIMAPKMVVGGQATVTNGSATVVGTKTAWTAAMVGMQFRIGYNNPVYSVIAVDEAAQVLTLELPWGSPSVTSGYFLAGMYYSLGPNIKYLKSMVNMQMAYRFDCRATMESLDAIDPWRSQGGAFPYIAASMPAAPDGSYQVELYPSPGVQQAFPFRAYIQPPNLVNDTDNLPPYIRGDIIIKEAIAEALVIGGPKRNPVYDQAESRLKHQDFEAEVLRAANADENLYRTEIERFGEGMQYYSAGGAMYDAQHAIGAGGGGWYD